jgi:enamine deaminase RidA (YjgF/YER057c/UK114 family)
VSQPHDAPEGPVRLLRSRHLSPAVPYACAAATDRPGRLLFTAGACPLDAEGRTVAPGDVVAQAEQVVANLRTVLEEAGAGLDAVVKSTVFVASSDPDDLRAAWEVVSDAFGEHDAPSTLLGVAALGWPDQLVEVEAVAVLPDAG